MGETPLDRDLQGLTDWADCGQQRLYALSLMRFAFDAASPMLLSLEFFANSLLVSMDFLFR